MKCKKCTVQMVIGKAICDDSFVSGVVDFIGDTSPSQGQTYTALSSGRFHEVFKCPSCGFSVTKGSDDEAKQAS